MDLQKHIATLAVSTLATISIANGQTATYFTNINRLPDRSIEVTHAGQPGIPYQLWAGDTLPFNNNTWQILTNAAFGSTETFTDTQATNHSSRFYVIRCGASLGAGTPVDPWVITSTQELQAMNLHLDGHYALGCNIDCRLMTNWNNGKGFLPIGDKNHPFIGSLNGKGKTISGLYINRPAGEVVGLIGFGWQPCTVVNLNLEQVNVTGGAYTAALFAVIYNGVLTNDYVASGSIFGTNVVAGLGGLYYHDANGPEWDFNSCDIGPSLVVPGGPEVLAILAGGAGGRPADFWDWYNSYLP